MICKIKGILVEKKKDTVILEKDGFFYQINIPVAAYAQLKEVGQAVELIIYHYLNITKNKGVPVLIGFMDQLEKEFFEKFISVSGVGPKAALRAFDKPVSLIAGAIEEADINFLTNLAGIGKQRAKQIIAHLQGKVGRFALLKKEIVRKAEDSLAQREVTEEAKQILRRLQYKAKEIDGMVKKAFIKKPEIQSTEELLNEIYRQKKVNQDA